jgi:hypothetical protein
MPLDSHLENAIRDVVTSRKQPAEVSKRLIAWLKALSDGDVSTEDKARYLDTVCKALDIEEAGDED